MLSTSQHLLKINGIYVSSIRMHENGNYYFLDNQFGWLELDNKVDISMLNITEIDGKWIKASVGDLLTVIHK